jgi:hypothetical protein
MHAFANLAKHEMLTDREQNRLIIMNWPIRVTAIWVPNQKDRFIVPNLTAETPGKKHTDTTDM